MDEDALGLESLLQHLGEEKGAWGPAAPPLVQTSTFVFESLVQFDQGMVDLDSRLPAYTRVSNPTTQLAQRKIAAIEGAESCLLTASGMGAISAVIMANTRAGAHVVAVENAYGPTYNFLEYLRRFGVNTTWVDGRDADAVLSACRPETSLIYLESPTSGLFRMQDIGAIASFARERGIATAIDNTYAAGIHQKPLAMGVDYSLHTVSKYFGGHSDVVAGAACCSKARMEQLRADENQLLGATIGPFTSWLVLRGLRTLPLRLAQSERSVQALAGRLTDHPAVDEVIYPGLPSHPQHDLFRRQMSGTAGLLTVVPKVQERARLGDVFQRLRLFKLGVSWGGHESLAVPMSPHPMDWAEPRHCIRFYCGLETTEDLVEDAWNALMALA
ncbi:MAG: PLP-dependent transferase [Fimbriimonadaceae bacterium]|nr:PLP-dependent transferase [Fimbriimonadaceae bacterium]